MTEREMKRRYSKKEKTSQKANHFSQLMQRDSLNEIALEASSSDDGVMQQSTVRSNTELLDVSSNKVIGLDRHIGEIEVHDSE